MFPQTHLVLGERLIDRIGAEDAADFNLGAILPDIRYFNGMAWEVTHPPIERFCELANSNGTEDRDFALGYLSHLAADQWEPWFLAEAGRRSRFLRILPRRITKLLLEAGMLEAYPLRDIPMTRRVPNLALDIGIPAHAIHELRKRADPLLARPTVAEAIAFVRDTSLAQVGVIRFLMWAAQILLRTPLRSLVLRPAVRVVREITPLLERRVMEDLRPALASLRFEEEGEVLDVAPTVSVAKVA